MSEAILLVILTPIAGAVATLLLKMWDTIANNKQSKAKHEHSFRDELRQELDRKNKELSEEKKENLALREAESKREQEAQLWQRDYFELYAMFYPLRLLINTLPEADSGLARAAIGPAPHERRVLDTPGPT